jgi:hypothetical protein
VSGGAGGGQEAGEASRGRDYPGEPYWEREQPREARTGRLWLSYFPQAGKLQIRRFWLDRDGRPRRAQGLTLDVEDFAVHLGAVELLQQFAAEVVGLG